MENLTAKVSQLKGLCDGLSIDGEKPEGKLLTNIIDVLKDIAEALDDVIDAHDELEEKVDEIDQDLADIEDIAYGDDDEDYDDEELTGKDLKRIMADIAIEKFVYQMYNDYMNDDRYHSIRDEVKEIV